VSDLHELSAVEALVRMRAKEVSPVELLDAVLARAAAAEGTVHAFAETREEEAAAAARASADRYARGEGVRPLEGLPVAFKEELEVEGWRMRFGSLAIDEVATRTAPVAERILGAGAVVHARTTTDRKSTRLNSSHTLASRMPSSA